MKKILIFILLLCLNVIIVNSVSATSLSEYVSSDWITSVLFNNEGIKLVEEKIKVEIKDNKTSVISSQYTLLNLSDQDIYLLVVFGAVHTQEKEPIFEIKQDMKLEFNKRYSYINPYKQGDYYNSYDLFTYDYLYSNSFALDADILDKESYYLYTVPYADVRLLVKNIEKPIIPLSGECRYNNDNSGYLRVSNINQEIKFLSTQADLEVVDYNLDPIEFTCLETPILTDFYKDYYSGYITRFNSLDHTLGFIGSHIKSGKKVAGYESLNFNLIPGWPEFTNTQELYGVESSVYIPALKTITFEVIREQTIGYRERNFTSESDSTYFDYLLSPSDLWVDGKRKVSLEVYPMAQMPIIFETNINFTSYKNENYYYASEIDKDKISFELRSNEIVPFSCSK